MNENFKSVFWVLILDVIKTKNSKSYEDIMFGKYSSNRANNLHLNLLENLKHHNSDKSFHSDLISFKPCIKLSEDKIFKQRPQNGMGYRSNQLKQTTNIFNIINSLALQLSIKPKEFNDSKRSIEIFIGYMHLTASPKSTLKAYIELASALE